MAELVGFTDGRTLKALRNQKGKLQSDVAQELHINTTLYARWEQGVRPMTQARYNEARTYLMALPDKPVPTSAPRRFVFAITDSEGRIVEVAIGRTSTLAYAQTVVSAHIDREPKAQEYFLRQLVEVEDTEGEPRLPTFRYWRLHDKGE